MIDINWFDTYITTNVLPTLKAVNPSNSPGSLMLYNVVLASPVTNLNTCCILGYLREPPRIPHPDLFARRF